jgi:hypothetical protein
MASSQAERVNPYGPVLWIDPGQVTGLAVWVPQQSAVTFTGFLADEWEFSEAADGIEWLCSNYRNHLTMGWEHFSINAATHKKTASAHHAIEMIGVARRYSLQYHCKNVGPAQPEQRKKATMAMLQAIGWWVPGKDDAQSAAQHMLAWMFRAGCVPDREAVTLAALRSRSGENDG